MGTKFLADKQSTTIVIIITISTIILSLTLNVYSCREQLSLRYQLD